VQKPDGGLAYWARVALQRVAPHMLGRKRPALKAELLALGALIRPLFPFPATPQQAKSG
jgi:hypothetical protein